jgi:hypothetical protein
MTFHCNSATLLTRLGADVKKKTIVERKKPGPPKTTGPGTLIGIRVHAPALAALDKWRASQEDIPTRAESVRRLMEIGLEAEAAAHKSKRSK